MGEIQLFHHLVYEIQSLFSHAKAIGWIEKYDIALSVQNRQATSAEQIGIMQKILHSLQNTMQMMLAEYQRFSQEPFASTASAEAKQLSNYHPSGSSDARCYAPDRVYGGGKKVDCEHVAVPEKMGKCLPQQLPTTKETEAANVLMNLSGKAADRTVHTRLEGCTVIHQDQIESDAAKPTIYVLPPGTSNASVKREYPVCDEVPQINEKDLLPLATQVLCQFCSQQCEDLVELHEHVLAMHNMSETEPPFMTYKKMKAQSQDDALTVGRRPKESEPRNYEQGSPYPDELLSPVNSFENVLRQENENRKLLEEKKLKKPKSRKGNQNVETKNTTSEGSNELTPGTVENANNREIWEIGKDSRHTVTHDININIPNNLYRKCPSTPGEQAPLQDNEKNPHQSQEQNAVTSDALAIAIESSKIRVIEAKVTIFVCLKCSTCYTNSQEFKVHTCKRIQPVIQRCPDGSVSLVNHITTEENHAQSTDEVWYFPEFLIRQQRGDKKEVGDLEILDNISGHRLRLHTSCQPSYLSEQLISFRCQTCEKDSDSLSKFFDHLTKGPCMFRCPDCSLVYVTQDKLQKHRSSLHPTLEDRTCPNCNVVFEKRHQRNKHVKTQCSQLHVCDTCGSVLKNEYNLRVHMLSHQDRKHKCELCGAAFHRRVVLTRHMMRHSGTKPHACSQCNARFYTKQHLKTHLDRHSGIKRFPCSACDKAYYSNHERNTHFTKVHNRTPCGEKALFANEQKIVKLSDINSISFI